MMADAIHVLAYDLGASSCRATIGTFSAPPTTAGATPGLAAHLTDGSSQHGGRGECGTPLPPARMLLDGRRMSLTLTEVGRCETRVLRSGVHRCWDVPHILAFVRTTLAAAAARVPALHAVGVDSWGVDYGLYEKNGQRIRAPYHYRDSRTDAVMFRALARCPRNRLWAAAGLQTLRFNTAFQLCAHGEEHPEDLDAARSILLIADIVHDALVRGEDSSGSGGGCDGGEERGAGARPLPCEYTLASTTQLLDARRRVWSSDVVAGLGLPAHLFTSPVVPPGHVCGAVASSWFINQGSDDSSSGSGCGSSGAGAPAVIMPASHDTASAVVAVPVVPSATATAITAGAGGGGGAAGSGNWAYISSGTWSIVGIESPTPHMDVYTMEHGFANEGGVDGTYRVLRNVQGMWIVNECMASWRAAGTTVEHSSIPALVARATEDHGHFTSLVYPDHDSFQAPDTGTMETALAEYCEMSGQSVPQGPGPVILMILESLAFRYREVIDMLETIAGHRIDTIHVVGGGSQNPTLCQYTANACRRRVVAGPAEASTIGNVLVQARALLSEPRSQATPLTLADLRGVVRRCVSPVSLRRGSASPYPPLQNISRSFALRCYEPEDGALWARGFQTYTRVTARRDSYREE